MGAPPYALSVSHFVSSVGADAGFAALVGLAFLILLYFAQARETSTLRDRFAEADDQVRQLEQRVAQLSRTTAAPAGPGSPAPAPAPQRQGVAGVAAPVPSPARPPQPAPAAPAFVGAPALAAATRFVPRGDEAAIAIRARDAQVAAPAARAEDVAPAARVPVGAGVAAGGGGSSAPPSAPARPGQTAAPGPTGPAPATAAGAGVSAGNGGQRPTRPAPAAAPKPYRIAGARPPGSTPPARRPVAPPPEPSRLRGGLLIAAGLLLVVAVVAVLVVVTSNGGSSTASSSSAAKSPPSAATRKRQARPALLKPSTITVAVLNGTATTNLAHDISLKLSGYGYRPGTIATATDQTQTATVVGYLPGQRRAALVVARSLNLGSASVQPVGQSNQAVACPQASCSAQVVVTVGSDLASAASTSASSSG